MIFLLAGEVGLHVQPSGLCGSLLREQRDVPGCGRELPAERHQAGPEGEVRRLGGQQGGPHQVPCGPSNRSGQYIFVVNL